MTYSPWSQAALPPRRKWLAEKRAGIAATQNRDGDPDPQPDQL